MDGGSSRRRDRLTDIRDNLTTHLAEAEREGWRGEVEGLKISLAGAHPASQPPLTRPDHRSDQQLLDNAMTLVGTVPR